MFEDQEIGEASGKNIDALLYSRSRRLEILRLFEGQLPESIIKAKRSTNRDDIATGSYQASASQYPKADDPKLESIFDVSNQDVRGGALSRFPQNIGEVMIRLYTKPFDLIIDPFAGHNSRMSLAVKEERHYQGYDISSEFMAMNRIEKALLVERYPDIRIDLVEADSRHLSESPDASGDFTITSPPYYNLERYGDQPEQLGKAKTYEMFLEELGKVCAENYRVLKDQAFCVWFINDFRKSGRFHPFHMDVARLLTDAGFVFWDILIVDIGYAIRSAFATQIVNDKILPKRHEYGLVFRKEIA